MSLAQHDRQPAATNPMDPVHNANATEYQSMRGCLTLTAIITFCIMIAVILALVFGSPVD